MQIEEAKKILKGMFYNDNGEKMHYIDFFDSYGDEWGGYTLPEYIEAIETVLNELEKKEAEIDKLRNTNKDLLKKLRNRVKEVKKLTRYSLYKKEFARLNKQLEKKDTVIDLMAKKLVEAHGWFYSEFDNYTKEDFKQYFYKKAEEK